MCTYVCMHVCEYVYASVRILRHMCLCKCLVSVNTLHMYLCTYVLYVTITRNKKFFELKNDGWVAAATMVGVFPKDSWNSCELCLMLVALKCGYNNWVSHLSMMMYDLMTSTLWDFC